MKVLESISWDNWFMKRVYLVASKSKDPRTHIGAVIVQNGVAISDGYNGFPRGVYDTEQRYLDREIKYKFVVHAEVNSIINAARIGVSTLGATMYTQGIPCDNCAKAVVNAGIKKIIYHNLFPNHGAHWAQAAELSKVMFKEAGVTLSYIDEKLGVIALVDGKTVEL